MMVLQSPYAAPVSALVYADWTFYLTDDTAVSKFSDGVDRNRLFATGTASDVHLLRKSFAVTAGATHRMTVYLQADTTALMGLEYYNNGTTYAGGHDVNLSTGAVTTFTVAAPTVTDLGGGVWKLVFDYVIPSGVTSLEIRHLIYNTAGAATFIAANEGYFASSTVFPESVPAPAPATDSTIAVTGQFPAYGVHRVARHGPFIHNGNIYVLLPEKGSDGLATNLNVYKSTDGGATWAGTNILTVHSGQCMSAVQVANNIYFGFTNGTNLNGARRYDMGTDSLFSTPAPGNACNVDIAGARPLVFAYRPNNDYLFGRQGSLVKVNTTNYRRAVMDYRNQTAATTQSAASVDALGTTAAHGDIREVYADADDRVWIFYTRSDFPTNLYCRIIEPGTTAMTATEHVVATETLATAKYVVGAPTEYVNGTTRYVVIPYISSVTGNPLRYVRITSAATPAFLSVEITTSTPESDTSNIGSLVENANLLHAVFALASDDDLYDAKQSAVGGTFSAPASQKVGVMNGISAEQIGTKVGVVYNDGGTVKFRSYEA